jgi:hypothetical protein
LRTVGDLLLIPRIVAFAGLVPVLARMRVD